MGSLRLEVFKNRNGTFPLPPGEINLGVYPAGNSALPDFSAALTVRALPFDSVSYLLIAD
jgi:hypothetical protein